MPHKVRTEVAHVTLPGVGRIDDASTQVILTDADFALIPAAAFSTYVTDLGYVGSSGDVVGTQAAYVAALGALTSAAPDAVTSSAPAAVTSSQNSTTNGSDAGTTQTLANALKVSYNAAQVDIAALRTTLAAVQADVVALRATLLATQADTATIRTKVNAELSALQGAGKPQAAS